MSLKHACLISISWSSGRGFWLLIMRCCVESCLFLESFLWQKYYHDMINLVYFRFKDYPIRSNSYHWIMKLCFMGVSATEFKICFSCVKGGEPLKSKSLGIYVVALTTYILVHIYLLTLLTIALEELWPPSNERLFT